MGNADRRFLGVWASLANVVVETALTALAFVVLDQFGLVGNWPLPALLGFLVLGGVLAETGMHTLRKQPHGIVVQVAVGAQVLAVTVIIYAIGWGPTLALGYVFVLARMIDVAGARMWRPTVTWTLIGIALGQ